ncbi:hypothetical protein V6L77_11230 [Pannonibacter sp. Pt2-lr]
MIFLVAVGLSALIFTNRQFVVKHVPDLASLFDMMGLPVNLRGLEFRDLRTFREVDEGTIVLVVEGTIQSVSEQPAAVPAVRLSLRSEDQQEIYAWTLEPRAVALEPGADTRFRTRLTDPPQTPQTFRSALWTAAQDKQQKRQNEAGDPYPLR